MSKKLNLFLIILIASQIAPILADTSPQEITITLQREGITRLDYIFQTEITSLQTNVSLLGETYQDILIINEEGLTLEYFEKEDGFTVYSLGSSLVNVTYFTAELTGKSSVIWSLSVILPISTKIILPTSATIINLNTLPLEISSFDEKTVLVMPAGQIDIEYTIDILDSEALAEEAINLAEEAIQDAENSGAIVTPAKTKLIEAKSLFQQSSYLSAEESATQVVDLVAKILEKMTIADVKITATDVAIQIARESGKTTGLDEAESLLFDAQSEYNEGDYDKALTYAEQALEAALKTEKADKNTLIIAAGFIVIIAVGAYFVTQRKPTPEHVSLEFEIDLDRLFNEHPELRMDDREVLKYLAENDGEAFAFDIRDRFDIPRTSTWRMIQRLQRNEVVDERKIGGQSLISIKEKYRRHL